MPINKTADNAHAKYRIRVPMTYTKVLGITHSGHLGQISVSWGTKGRRFKSSQSDRGSPSHSDLLVVLIVSP